MKDLKENKCYVCGRNLYDWQRNIEDKKIYEELKRFVDTDNMCNSCIFKIADKLKETAKFIINDGKNSMKLYELRPAKSLKINDDPWNPWYDKCFGFVIRAENEIEARKMAHENAGDENNNMFLGAKISDTNSPWIDPKYSTCEELKQDGESCIIIEDFRSA